MLFPARVRSGQPCKFSVQRLHKHTLLASLFLVCLTHAQTPPPQQPFKPTPAPPAITKASLAGHYNGGQMEVGAELLLKPDGHFQYELAYGALDESAEGTWDFHDNAVFLTTVPAAVLPTFTVLKDEPAPAGELWIAISNGPIMEGARQRIYLLYDADHEPDMIELPDDGRVTLPNKRMPAAIIPEIPIYPIYNPIPLTGTGGHHLTLRFNKNDIGKADFRATKLTLEGTNLIMIRPDLQLKLTFRR